ncbi:hypothetical protein MMC18_005504 [Xylographa bjoerkii]|nr:hypothetical protein [Xylographa bjoerkii]
MSRTTPYSHTHGGEEEVSLQDIEDPKSQTLFGAWKIKSCCARAFADGLDFVWIDTCCIDKTSSAELSEAINSMFEWYRGAQVCYAYLDDVPSSEDDHSADSSAFRKSRWFTRGWTLQELLAPEKMIFFCQDWNVIGTKYALAHEVSSITKINEQYLFNFETASVAARMSWASRRETTRPEDKAYSLMGIFKVNMPLLYGEGRKAFYKLQLQILDMVDDESIFAWTGDTYRETYHGRLLASSPADFFDCGDISLYESIQSVFDVNRPPYTMTNKGLRVEPLLIRHSFAYSQIFIAPLNCSRGKEKESVAILLEWETPHNKWIRILPAASLEYKPPKKLDNKVQRHIVYVRQLLESRCPHAHTRWERASYHGGPNKSDLQYQVNTASLAKEGFTISKYYLSHPLDGKWTRTSDIFEAVLSLKRNGTSTALSFRGPLTETLIVILHIRESVPVVDVVVSHKSLSLNDVVHSFRLQCINCKEQRMSRTRKYVWLAERLALVTMKERGRKHIVEIEVGEQDPCLKDASQMQSSTGKQFTKEIGRQRTRETEETRRDARGRTPSEASWADSLCGSGSDNSSR